MSKLSVVIISLNEERSIGKCIDSVGGIADEIVVVDSFSTDSTEQIAKAKGTRFIQHAFGGHIEQKNYAKEQARYDYVLSLDADETLSDDLRRSILSTKANGFEHDGYSMNRLNFYCGRAIKSCGWYPDRKLRLWNRHKGEWRGQNPHDRFEMFEGANVTHLHGDIHHDTYPDHEQFLQQVDKFATISAKHLQARNSIYLLAKMIFSPPVKFLRNYFLKGGIKEGGTGLMVCYHQAREVFLKYLRALKLKMS